MDNARPFKQARIAGHPLAVQHSGGYAVAMDSPLFMPVLQVGQWRWSKVGNRRAAFEAPHTRAPLVDLHAPPASPQVEPSPTTGMTNIIPPLFQQQQPVVKRGDREPAAIEQQRLPPLAGPPPMPIIPSVSYTDGARGLRDGRAPCRLCKAVVGLSIASRPPKLVSACLTICTRALRLGPERSRDSGASLQR